jgi:NADH-quinone oxidoreductase subunit E
MVVDTMAEEGDSLSVIDVIVQKHNTQPGAVMPVLQAIQDNYGYVPPAAIQRVAANMGISASRIYGIVTFYSQFRLRPIGKNLIKVCHGTACHLNGAERIAEALAQLTAAGEGETSADGEFTVEQVACLGCCSLAPCIMVNNETHGNLTPESIAKIVEQAKGTETLAKTE